MARLFDIAQQKLINEEENIPILTGNWDKNIYTVIYNNEGTYKRIFIAASTFEDAMSIVKIVQTQDRELNEINKIELVLSGKNVKDYDTTLGIKQASTQESTNCPIYDDRRNKRKP